MEITITIQASVSNNVDIIGIKECVAYALEGEDVSVQSIDISEADV